MLTQFSVSAVRKSRIFLPPLSGCVCDVILSHTCYVCMYVCSPHFCQVTNVARLMNLFFPLWRKWSSCAGLCKIHVRKATAMAFLLDNAKIAPSTCLSEQYVMQDDIAMCTNKSYGRDQTDKKEINVPFGEYI